MTGTDTQNFAQLSVVIAGPSSSLAMAKRAGCSSRRTLDLDQWNLTRKEQNGPCIETV